MRIRFSLDEIAANRDLTLFRGGALNTHFDRLEKHGKRERHRVVAMTEEKHLLSVRDGNGRLRVFLFFPLLFFRARRDDDATEEKPAAKLRQGAGGSRGGG